MKIVRLKRRKSNTDDPEEIDKTRRSKHHKRVRLKRWKSGLCLEINKTKGGIYARVVRLKRRKHGAEARYIKKVKWRKVANLLFFAEMSTLDISAESAKIKF